MTDFEDGPAPMAESAAAPETPVIQPAETAQPPAETPQQPDPKPPEAKDPKWFRDAIKAREDRARQAERERDELRARVEQPAPSQENLSPQEAFERQQMVFNVSISERFARREHGALFEEAKVWLETRPDIEAWAVRQPDPWESAISLYRREKMAEEIGDNPEEWREKERARLREELMAEMGGGPQGGMTAAAPPRLPQSAATQRSSAPRGPIQQSSPYKNKFG